MANRIYIHSKENTKLYIVRYLLCLLPLILYGFYKNGFLLYQKDLINILAVPKVIYLLLISLGIYIITNIIFKNKNFWSLDLLYIAIIPLFMPQNINYFIYSIGLFLSFTISNILSKKFTFNKIAFAKLFIVLLAVIFSTYSYENPAETLNIYSLNFWDLLWGRNIGGIASTNIVLAIVILLLFSIITNYKKVCAYISIITYVVLALFLSGFDANIFLNSSTIVGLILLNSDLVSTPHNKMSMIIYGLCVGILTFLLSTYLNKNEGVFIAILILSFFTPALDKIVEKW